MKIIYTIAGILLGIHSFSQCNFKNIGHRGGSSYYYPENTLLSLKQAFIEGAWAAEVDVRFTSDSVMMLMHDKFIDRTTNGHGNIVDHTKAYMKSLDAGSWKGQQFQGIEVPTLVEAIQLAHEYNKKIYLNMKVYEPQMVASALAQSGAPPNTVMLDPDELYKVQEYHALMPDVPLVFFGSPPTDFSDSTFYQNLISNHVIAVELFAGDILDTNLAWPAIYRDKLHSYGLELWAYTVNDNGYIHSLKNFGIDGLETDRPAEAKNIICYNQAGGFFPEKRITGQWNFNVQNLEAEIGSHMVLKGDSTQQILFGTTSDFGISGINNLSVPVMKVPAFDSSHYLIFFSNIAPQGNPGGIFCDNDYSLIIDFMKPATTAPYISLYQTSNDNSDDGDLFIHTSDNSIGIFGSYFGNITDSVWYRLTAVFNLPEHVLNLYLNGTHIGDVDMTGELDGRFCINNNWGIQPSCLFSDNDGETSTLYVSSIQLRDYAMTYEEVNALSAPSANKIPITIDITGEICPDAIVLPSDLSICNGADTLVTALAGDADNYRWQINSGNGWTDFTDHHFSKSADDSLRISNADSTINNVQLRCKLSKNCVQYSTAVKLKVIPLPKALISDIGNPNLCPNETSFLSAQNDSTYHYLWIRGNSEQIGNSNSISITTPGSYHLIVNNQCGSDTSLTVNFNASFVPEIVNQPQSQTTVAGGNSLFNITVTGDSLSFQWQADTGSGWYTLINNSHFINTSSSTLGVLSANVNFDGIHFRCLIHGSCFSTLISDTVLLNVIQTSIENNSITPSLIYPNPNNGNFLIDIPENFNMGLIKIYNLEGKNISEFSMTSKNISLTLPDGIYLLFIDQDSTQLKKILIIQH